MDAARRQAADVGYPLLLKASAGRWCGRGMRVVSSPAELEQRLAQAGAEAAAAFSDSRIYMERYFPRVHHVEVQVFGDRHGNHVHLGERRLQRAASPPEARRGIALAGARPRTAPGDLRSRGPSRPAASATRTPAPVEFNLRPGAEARCYFIEMNTRIQVEHPVTEMVTGTDLVLEQLRVAAGEPLSFTSQSIVHRGHAIEWRINAEDPERGFLPTPGRLTPVVASTRDPGGACGYFRARRPDGDPPTTTRCSPSSS